MLLVEYAGDTYSPPLKRKLAIMASGTVGQKRFENLVDFMLVKNGTPRDYLFEYPHRADDSRTYIANAEKSALEVLNILGLTRKPPKATR